MIDLVEVENFKCFRQASFILRPLTVLTGVNGGGKSTLLQALLLARTVFTTQRQQTVELNGPYGIALGSAREVLHWAATDGVIGVRLRDTAAGLRSDVQFEIPTEEALHLRVRQAIDPLPALVATANGFTYLCAERLGPRDLLRLSASEPDDIGVGVRGEFAAQVLALRETRAVSRPRDTVRRELRHRDLTSPSPRLQTESWVSDIIRPIRVTAQLAAGVMASTIRFEEPGDLGETLRPANTGFGISYALPIIVAGLLSQPGDVLMVENPEAHLHPAGQSKLGRFLGRVAGSGVQVLVETHSDHILNGARLAVAQDGTLTSDDMIVHYFGTEGPTAIKVNARGEMDHWPTGFFDQLETDLGGLTRARRRR